MSPSEFSGDVSLAIFADNRLLEDCTGPSLIQTINSSLRWLADIVRERGDRLQPGQIVLTGSIPSLIPVINDCRIKVEAPPFGTVEATFVS
jgi:2-keto-4-pentenoate hydratase